MSELKVKTIYNYELLKELHTVLGSFSPRIVNRKKSESVSYGLLFMAAAGYVWYKWQFIEVVILCALIGAVLLCRGLCYYPFTAFVTDKLMKNHQRVNMFEFEEDCICAISSVGSKSRYTYDRCSDLMETERGFYFFMNGSGVVMEKQFIAGGTVDDLRALLEEKTGRTAEWFGKGGK